MCGSVGSSRGVKGTLRGSKLVGSGILSSLERIQIDTRARSSGIELTLGSLHIGVRCIEFCLRVLDGLLGGFVLIHAHSLELGLGVIEGFLGFIALCLGILERLGLVIDALVGLIELVVQVAQLLLLLLDLVDGRLKLVDLLLKRDDFCRVLLGRVVAQGLCSMVSLLLGLLLRLSRSISLLLGSVVGLLGGLELLCRLLGKLSRRLRNRLRSRCGGIARGTTPQEWHRRLRLTARRLLPAATRTAEQ